MGHVSSDCRFKNRSSWCGIYYYCYAVLLYNTPSTVRNSDKIEPCCGRQPRICAYTTRTHPARLTTESPTVTSMVNEESKPSGLRIDLMTTYILEPLTSGKWQVALREQPHSLLSYGSINQPSSSTSFAFVLSRGQ